jgi:hypothetical protein
MVSMAWIGMDNLDDESDDVVRNWSINSMAGTTVVRLGVPQEKNNVVSLKT